jgi:hypothetical protein
VRHPLPLRVPWATVIPLAVVLAYADGFWTVALRGAVGAIERTDAPFTTWLWESSLLLPLYVFAVLAALTLALRWFGPYPLRARAVATTVPLVVATATLVALGVLVASAAYDYQLQTAHLAEMNAVRHSCGADCLAVQERATLSLQVRAVGLGGGLLLASNLVLVALVVALRGGRLNLVSPWRRRAPRPETRFDEVRMFLVGGLLAAAAVHAVVVPEHLQEWPAAGGFFVALCAAEVAVAAFLLVGRRRAALLAAAILSAGTLALWAYSRTLGLPFGPEAGVPEGIGLADGAACLLEAATLAAATLALRPRPWLRSAATSQHSGRLALVAVAAVAVLGLGGGLAVFGDAGGQHGAVTARG